VIRIEREAPGRARVTGALVGESVGLLRDELARADAVLDLSGVEKADEVAVRLLAGLPPERCPVVSCPRWLALWVERTRQRSRTRTSR
jgi:hypothetical protein